MLYKDIVKNLDKLYLTRAPMINDNYLNFILIMCGCMSNKTFKIDTSRYSKITETVVRHNCGFDKSLSSKDIETYNLLGECFKSIQTIFKQMKNDKYLETEIVHILETSSCNSLQDVKNILSSIESDMKILKEENQDIFKGYTQGFRDMKIYRNGEILEIRQGHIINIKECLKNDFYVFTNKKSLTLYINTFYEICKSTPREHKYYRFFRSLLKKFQQLRRDKIYAGIVKGNVLATVSEECMRQHMIKSIDFSQTRTTSTFHTYYPAKDFADNDVFVFKV